MQMKNNVYILLIALCYLGLVVCLLAAVLKLFNVVGSSLKVGFVFYYKTTRSLLLTQKLQVEKANPLSCLSVL